MNRKKYGFRVGDVITDGYRTAKIVCTQVIRNDLYFRALSLMVRQLSMES